MKMNEHKLFRGTVIKLGVIAYKDVLDDYWYGEDGFRYDNTEIAPMTIGMNTRKEDKEEFPVFGSFDIEKFGRTRGGDRVKGYCTNLKEDEGMDFESEVFFENGGFCVKVRDTTYELYVGDFDLYLEILKGAK